VGCGYAPRFFLRLMQRLGLKTNGYRRGAVDKERIGEAVERMGYEVVTMDISAGKRRAMRLRVDHAGLDAQRRPVTVDDCAEISRGLRQVLDEIGETDCALEVSSPGVERPLVTADHYRRFAGERVRIRGFGQLADRSRVLEGVLVGVSGPGANEPDDRDLKIEMDLDGERVTVPFGAVAAGRLVWDWSARRAPGRQG